MGDFKLKCMTYARAQIPSARRGQLLFGILHLKDPLGHHKGPLVIGLPQVRDSHTVTMVGGMDHHPLSQVDAGMSNGVVSPAEEEKISRKQLGEIHLAGYELAHTGLFGTGAGQVDLEPLVNKLHKP